MRGTVLFWLMTAGGLLLAVYGLYFGVIALFGLRRRPRYPAAAPKTCFAVVIAARNEEAVIGNLIDSLFAQRYPRTMFEVLVVPNNCTDATEQVARSHGARILRPTGAVKGKGEALRQATDLLLKEGRADAICVFDADNLVDPDFLARMNDAYCAGAAAAQGFRDSKNPRQSAISGCYSICYWMLSRFYNAARESLGLSSLIGGSGFMVSCALLRRLGGWNTHTLTEDYEFSAQCVLAGERVRFVPDAIIFDEQPLTFRQSWKQRRRWTTGSLQGLQIYGGRLLAQAISEKRMISFDLWLTFLSPAIQMAAAVAGVLGTLAMLLWAAPTPLGLLLTVAAAAGSVLVSAVASSAAALAAVLLHRHPAQGMAKSILSFWLFLASWLAITFVSLLHRQRSWDPIPHTTALTLDQLAGQDR